MGGINPNPPVKESGVSTGLQQLFRYSVRNFNTAAPAVVATDNGGAVTAAGTQVAFPTYSTLNPVTRQPREVRQTGAVANTNAGWAVSSPRSDGSAVFPGANGDAGFRYRLRVGIDAAIGAIASTQLLCAISSNSLSVPVAGTPITNNALIWMGIYNAGGGGGLRFGFKPSGTGVIINLDSGTELAPLWATYQSWLLDIFCSPNGPRTFYTVSRLNASGSAYEPLLVGSTTLFAPGRVAFGWNFLAMPTAANQNTDLFATDVTVTTLPFGALSL